VIYFVRAGKRGCIKIGYTDKPIARRIALLQTACPMKLYLLLVVQGSATTEGRLHRRFASLHRRGEWFYPGRKLLDYIDSRQVLGAAGGPPTPGLRRRRPDRPGYVCVWVQAFTDSRTSLVLQWHDPETGKRKSRSAGTADYDEAEQRRATLEAELNQRVVDF
jgi:hypothetical protein